LNAYRGAYRLEDARRMVRVRRRGSSGISVSRFATVH
jgi:hypothetical protein